MNMKNICEKCYHHPGCHSFSKLCVLNDIYVFYTNPGEAKLYNDREGIIKHMENMLQVHIKSNNDSLLL